MENFNPITSPVGEDHLRAFGAIIHAFARHETLMISAMSVVVNADFMPIAMLTAELPYRGKRDTFRAMIKAKPLPTDQIERINWFLGQLHSKNKLRNAIAHYEWKDGQRYGAIKPLSLSVRDGVAKATGLDPSERDYTANELIDEANYLVKLHAEFMIYLSSVGLLPRAKSDNSKPSISS